MKNALTRKNYIFVQVIGHLDLLSIEHVLLFYWRCLTLKIGVEAEICSKEIQKNFLGNFRICELQFEENCIIQGESRKDLFDNIRITNNVFQLLKGITPTITISLSSE